MLVIGILGGLGMGTAIDWYPEAQRIQSARTVKDASWSIWAGSALVLVRNALWAVAILGFFVLYPGLTEVKDYEMAWFRLGFENLPPGMIGFFFAAIVAIHISTISTHLNLGAVYITRDLYHHYINPKADQRRLVHVGRVATLILLLGSFVFGSIMENITEWLIFALWIMAIQRLGISSRLGLQSRLFMARRLGTPGLRRAARPQGLPAVLAADGARGVRFHTGHAPHKT
jgi:Na+/proline symporter